MNKKVAEEFFMKTLKFLLISLAICSFILAIITLVDWIKVANAINDANNALSSIGAGQINDESGTFKFIMQIVFYVLVDFASISIFIKCCCICTIRF